MHRIDTTSNVSSLPTPAATGTPGYFANGTVLDNDWANNVQEELMSPVLAAGLTPDKTNNGQLLTALGKLLLGATPHVMTASGNFTATRTGTYVVLGVGGGGAGGGTAATGPSTIAAASGGNSGTFGVAVVSLTAGQVVPVTIGAAGQPAAAGANAGGSGGNTTFGSSLTCYGGKGGAGSPASAPVFVINAATVSYVTTGGVWPGTESSGGLGLGTASGNSAGGKGGDSAFGGGASATNGGGGGNNAIGYGSGGSGASAPNSTAALQGGAGFQGYLLIFGIG